MASTRFLLVRHGETDWNIDRRMQGHTDIPLNVTGKMQAEKIATALKDYPIHTIYSSPLVRAHETARAIAKHHSEVPLVTREELRERSFGEYEGKTYDQINGISDRFHFSQSWNYPLLQPPGGERLIEVENRMQKFLEPVLNSHAAQTIAVVSHGVALRILIKILTQLPFSSMTNQRFDNASLSLVEHSQAHGGSIHFINYVGHL